jgi:hypothetical protein
MVNLVGLVTDRPHLLVLGGRTSSYQRPLYQTQLNLYNARTCYTSSYGMPSKINSVYSFSGKARQKLHIATLTRAEGRYL